MIEQVQVVGCQPASLDEGIGLTPGSPRRSTRPWSCAAGCWPTGRRPWFWNPLERRSTRDWTPSQITALALVAALAVKSLPDIARYLRIREL